MAALADICKVLGEWRNVQKYADADDVDILFNICSNHEVTVKQLLLTSAGSRSTILRRLRSLVERGLVTADPVARDRRARQLNLTAKGMRWATQIVQSLKGLSQTVATMDKARR
jgi:DNA-binding MarR family transcriptional regulator